MGTAEPTAQAEMPGDTPRDAGAAKKRKLPRRAIVARVVLGLLFVLGAYLAATPLGRANVRAAMLLPALITLRQPAPLVATGEQVRHTTMEIPGEAGPVYLDIYAPTGPPPPIPGEREGVVIIPGVGDNRTVDQLVNLSSSLARAGLVVVNMTTDSLIAYDLAPSDADAVVRAVLAAQHLPGVGHERVGILGFSAGGALACFAAADPRIHDSLAFMTLFGGYYDAETLLGEYGSRGYVADGQFVHWVPNPVPLAVFANAIADTLPPDDAGALRGAFTIGGVNPLSAEQVAQLSPPAAAAYHLLAGDQPDAVAANLAALSPQMRKLLADLSPRTIIAQVKAPIYLLHDRNDEFIPYTQSRAFAAALTRLSHPHTYAEFGIFAHVEVKSGVGGGQLLRDAATLFWLLSQMLLPGS